MAPKSNIIGSFHMIHLYDIFTITLDDITFFININSSNKSEQFAGKEIIILQEKRLISLFDL